MGFDKGRQIDNDEAGLGPSGRILAGIFEQNTDRLSKRYTESARGTFRPKNGENKGTQQ